MSRRSLSFVGFLLALALLLTVVPSGWAKEPATPEIGLNQAVEMALKHSKSVRKADKEIDRTREMRDYQADELDYVPLAPPGHPAVEVPWSQFILSDLTWSMSKKSLTAEEDKVALDACNKYWAIQKAQEKLTAAEASARQAELDFRKAQVCNQVGLINGATLEGARAALEGARSGLDAAYNELDSAYAAFNEVVDLWPEDRPILTDEVTFAPLDVVDLNYEVARVLSNSPTVWLADQKIYVQKQLEDLMFYTGDYRPYKARKIEVEQAELDAMSAKEAYSLLTRSLYYTTKSIEDSIPAAEQAVRLAEENLKVAQAKFAVGMVTQSDVAAAEAGLAKAESDLLSAKANHAYLKLAFEKPWAYAAGGSAGAQ